jgi:hypothetical protein
MSDRKGIEAEGVSFFCWNEEFKEYSGKVIAKDSLLQHPESLFTKMASNFLIQKNFNPQLEGFVIECTPQTLDNVAHFYNTGQWRNPHTSLDHRLEFNEVDGDFYQVAQEYLNLPTDNIEEPDEDPNDFIEEEDDDCSEDVDGYAYLDSESSEDIIDRIDRAERFESLYVEASFDEPMI